MGNYTKQVWVDVVDPTSPPAGAVEEKAASFNYMEQGISDAYDRADAAYALAQNAGTGGSSSTLGNMGRVWLDSFGGASDDAKLDAALAAVAADTYPRGIQLGNREYTFATVNRTPFDGLRIFGPDGYGNPERGTKTPGRAKLTGSGPWFTCGTSTYFQVSLHSLTFLGGPNASVLGGSSGQFYCLSMRDIYSSGLKSILGTTASKLLMTGATLTGDWEINNCTDLVAHLGGSDNRLWIDGGLMDSNTSNAGTPGRPHLWMDSLDKTRVGPLYITAEGNWSAILVSGHTPNTTGNNQGGPVVFTGLTIEGRNEGAPCNGALVRVQGGVAKFRDCDFNFAMASASTMGHTPADAGVIHHTGGIVHVLGGNYDRASGVAETVPFLYTSGPSADAKVIARDMSTTARGGTWTGLPRVTLAGGGTDARTMDATVTAA